jgi:hypothetical protein
MDIARAIQKIRPGSIFTINDNRFESIVWFDKNTKQPSYKEVEDAWVEVEKEIKTAEIEKRRQEMYQNISDPIFFRYQRGDAKKEDWLQAVQEIKDSLPYPE